MNRHEHDELKARLQEALPPMRQQELERDLWPDLLRRIDRQPVRLTWFDWLLAAAALAGFTAFPSVIPWVLLQC
jgi:hypothetical protein